MKVKALLIALIASASMAKAATITVSAGFGATQGLDVYNGASLASTFTVSVGTFSSGVFTSFGSAIQDTAKVNTPSGITATGPSSFNSAVINLFVGGDATVEASIASGKYIVFRTSGSTTFPSDVTAAGSTTFSAALGTGLVVISSGAATQFTSAASATDGGRIVFVPEPSTALLGAVGVLGLLRRRRR